MVVFHQPRQPDARRCGFPTLSDARWKRDGGRGWSEGGGERGKGRGDCGVAATKPAAAVVIVNVQNV